MSMILIAATMLSPQAAPVADQSDKSKRVCRSMPTTGSLISRKRECRTQAEWDKLAQAGRANGEDIMYRNAGGIITN